MDAGTHAHGDADEDTGCDGTGAPEPETRLQIQYAPVLVHRKGVEDFYLLPVSDKLMQYDRLAVNTVVSTQNGGIATCDIPVSSDLEQFARDYRKLTGQVRESGESYELGEDYMVIGTSALAGYEIDGAVNIYAGCYNNPFLIWGKYRKKWLRATLPVSFQFHHTQMDGIPAAEFLERLQREIRKL